jgi:hypothetical protein
MKVEWNTNGDDEQRLNDFLKQNNGYFVQCRINRNVLKRGIRIERDVILKAISMCLLTTQQRSGPTSLVGRFLRHKPFAITYENILAYGNIEEYIRKALLEFGLNRYINRISVFFAQNMGYLQNSNWEITNVLCTLLNEEVSKYKERSIADQIATTFKGFGPKQSRNFLQSLGLTKHEIPIDSRTIAWLNQFGFPISLSPIALQDTGYYHFISDGIQHLCEKIEVYPCVLDAAIFSSFDTEEWNEENIVF